MEKKFSHNFPKRDEHLPPREVHKLPDYPTITSLKPFRSDPSYTSAKPIVIDFGKTSVRVGMSGSSTPYLDFPTLNSRYKDRKLNKLSTFIGNDIFIDSTIKSNMKNPFDNQLLTNWDNVEKILDYSFLHLGVDSENRISNPIIFNEILANPLSQRKNLSELLFETYNIPALTFGIDSLFSYYQNNGKTGLVIGTNHESINIIPMLNSNPLLGVSKRINIGGHQLYDFMRSSINLKYPYFPTRLNDYQISSIVNDYCYISENFNKEIKHVLDLDYLEKNDIIIEAPFNEIIIEEKSQEQIELDELKRKENIKKLQNKAKLKRLEKLRLKQKDFEYYQNIKKSFQDLSKLEIINLIKESGFEDENDLDKYLSNLEKSLKKAKLLQQQDDDDDNNNINIINNNNSQTEDNESDNNKYDFSILDKPNDQLSPEELKEKRRLRLIKSNIDSKLRQKKEKEDAMREAEELKRKDIEFRENDLENWIISKRNLLNSIILKRKERIKLKNELNDRKSRASQQRMKNIASLADDTPSDLPPNKRRHTTIDNDPNDTFGKNDDDWLIYRDIADIDDEELSNEELEEIYLIEKDLLEFDPNFDINDTQERQFNYKNSIIHKFLRGPRDFDNEDQHQLHQIHLNVERIRIPEIIFQPSIIGIDQAGLNEVIEDTLLKRLPQELGFSGDTENLTSFTNDIFLTGGLINFKNFNERLNNEIKSILPTHLNFKIRSALNPTLDAWKGMSKWSFNDYSNNNLNGFWSKSQYDEFGIEYMTDNGFGCVNLT